MSDDGERKLRVVMHADEAVPGTIISACSSDWNSFRIKRVMELANVSDCSGIASYLIRANYWQSNEEIAELLAARMRSIELAKGAMPV